MATHLCRLDEQLTASEVQRLGGLPSPPVIHRNEEDSDEDVGEEDDNNDDKGIQPRTSVTRFAEITWITAKAIKDAGYKPLLIPIPTYAIKNPTYTLCPWIGHGISIPSAARTSDAFPVWYFFYGKLTESDRLNRLLDLSEDPYLRKAFILGAVVRPIRSDGTILGLFDGTEDSRVDGCAYQVQSEEHEWELRRFETNAYEIARCKIRLQDSDEEIEGLTFRSAVSAVE